LTVNTLPERETNFNRKFPRGRCQAKWSTEFPINKREVMRVELLVESSGRSTIDIRRWSTAGKNPTRRGVAFGVHHLPAILALLTDALNRVREEGLFPGGGADV
jgi:hypothetical protein